MKKKEQPKVERVSATAMRRRFSDYFNRIVYGGLTVEVYRSHSPADLVMQRKEKPEKGDAV